MRFSLKFIASLYIIVAALSGCGESSTMDKPEKSGASSGKEEVVLRIAHTSESAGDFAEAEKQFKQAVNLSGNSIEARMELVAFYQRHNGERQAITVLNDALKIQPNNIIIMRELANTYINDAKPEDALDTINKAIAVNGKDAFLYNTKGVALDMLGRYEEAQKAYQTALLLSPEDATTFKINLSMSYILSGSYDQAIRLLRPLINGPDATPTMRQNLALAYGMKGENDEALKLGLKDLSTTEAQENLKFYRMLAAKHKNQKKLSSEKIQKTLPIEQLSEEDTPEEDAANKPIAIKSTETEAVSVTNTPTNIDLPVPTLKPDKAR